MSKELEALHDLYKLRAEMLEEKVCHKDSKWQENIKIYDRWGDNLICIETALKRLGEENVYLKAANQCYKIQEELWEKQDEVLQIIKEKLNIRVEKIRIRYDWIIIIAIRKLILYWYNLQQIIIDQI